jgi:hypothetical protein
METGDDARVKSINDIVRTEVFMLYFCRHSIGHGEKQCEDGEEDSSSHCVLEDTRIELEGV